MNWIAGAIRQPVTVAVGVILVLLAGVISFQRIPIQLTPNVEDTIVAVTTHWEGASPDEVEQEVVDPQEEKLQGISNLRQITSVSRQGGGVVRLEFTTGTPKETALREVSDKLREVKDYPNDVDEPVIEASDPENKDYIAWIILETTDPDLDIHTLQDFAEDRIKPVFERIPGMAEINVLGGREREVQVRFDATLLAQRGITTQQLVDALQRTNRNVSAGAVAEDKSDVRLRFVSQYERVEDVENTTVRDTPAGPIRVRDVAEVVETFKEPVTFVRSRGKSVIAINAQREVGSNVMEVMDRLRTAVDQMNEPGALLDSYARGAGLKGGLKLTQVYDQTIYIDDALALVRSNIWFGGGLAVLVLLLFLRSLKSSGIIALSIPISIIGAVVVMVALGRSINVISLAGMAFAVGMVVDNAIVVLENTFRHLEMGKSALRAAIDGTKEVFGAVVASTLTTVVVFVPILLIQDEAGQLFRDISLAIVAAVTLSLFVSVTVIPASAARLLRNLEVARADDRPRRRSIPTLLGDFIYWATGSVLVRVGVVVLMTAASVYGTWKLIPPKDYLPTGNRNLVFGLLIPPPGYSIEQQVALGHRIEERIRPFWELSDLTPGTPEYEAAKAKLPEIPTFDAAYRPSGSVVPPAISNYFLVSFDGIMFHGGISADPERVVDMKALFDAATRSEIAPGVLAFSFQVPLFRLGGSSGSAVKINFTGDDLASVSRSALAVFMDMMGRYGPGTVQPDPGNFNVPTPELQVVPDLIRLSESGLSPAALATAVQALGDGALIGDYRTGGETIDLKVIAKEALEHNALAELSDQPIATPAGKVVPLASLADLHRVNAPPQINRSSRRRAVTLQFTPPVGVPLEQAISDIDQILKEHRANGTIPFDVDTTYTGSASKLASVQAAMLGDGTLVGTLGSSLFLALLVVYLLMCVLFQSFLRPLIILFSVPLATLGGFVALHLVHRWSVSDRYMPIQNLDILTMLGFVILIGVVVNNAILIVHQSINFMKGDEGAGMGEGDWHAEPLPPRRAIAESVKSRVRPIFMTTLTSVVGMAPLVLMPGSGSELYRGLGSVVVGGLIVSTIFTLVLVPMLLSLVSDAQDHLGVLPERPRATASAAPARRGAVAPTAFVLLLAASLALLAGCAGRAPSRQVSLERLVENVNEQQLEQLGPPGSPAQPLRVPTSPVEEIVKERMPELEALGGPQAWAGVEPRMARDLLGEEQRIVPVDLMHAVATGVDKNLGIQFANLQPDIAAQDITIAEAVFDPELFSNLLLNDSEDLSPVPILGGIQLGAARSALMTSAISAGIEKRLQSGASVSASTFLQYTDDKTDGIDFDPDPAWRSGVALGLTQPLLRGFGSDVNRANIELSRNEYERTVHDLKAELLLLVAGIEQAYWDLKEAWSRLRIQEHLTAQGIEVERVLAERRSFDAALAQYSDAQATVERRRADLLRAQRLVKAASDRLKTLMYSSELPPGDESLLEPSSGFDVEPIQYQLRDAVAVGLKDRPEIRRALLAIEDAQLREMLADDLLKPQLDLGASVSLAGLDDAPGTAYDSLTSDDVWSYLVGLTFRFPIGNRAARAEQRRAQLEQSASLVRYEQAVLDVVVSVKEALRDVRTNYALIAASRSSRIAESENLRALLVEKESRSSYTPEFLNLEFQRQERLAQAQLLEVEAMANYDRALAAYFRALGSGGPYDRLLPPPPTADEATAEAGE